MNINRRCMTIGLATFLLIAPACSFSVSTANLSGLKIGKDKAVSQPATTFAPGETIYAVADVSNAPGAVKVKGQLVVENVEGQKPGPIPGLEASVDLPGSGQATFTFSPPEAGWPKGTYRLDVDMLEGDGPPKGHTSATFTVS